MKQLINTYSILSISIIFCGFTLGYVSSLKIERILIEISFNSFDKFSFDFRFFKTVFVRNLTVSSLISIGGYFTAGTLTIFILLWNGFNLGSLFTYWHYSNLNISQFISLLFIHGIFELKAFIMFANIGFQGFTSYNNFLKTGVFSIKLTPKLFLNPTILLLFAAIIETILFSNF